MAISELDAILENRRWRVSAFPFQHVTGKQIFKDEIYRRLELAFRAVLERGTSEMPSRGRFSRIFRNYDAYCARIPQDPANPLALFLTREWHDVLANLFDMATTGDVSAELHHHSLGSRNGSIHNDFNPGWFRKENTEVSLNISDSDLCDYKTGKVKAEGTIPIQRIRAVACIFYLANEKWHRGDGGETSLYLTRDSRIEEPATSIVPENNSLIAFPVTPYSFHTFLRNRRHPRNSIVLWLHREYDNAIAEWGAKSVVQW